MAGEKRWRIHAPVHPLPHRDEPWTDHRAAVEAAAATPPVIEATLRPGDCLYLPRGYLHAATALGGVSTHLTLGVHAWTGRHLADELVAQAVRRAATAWTLREPLPLAVDLGDADELRPHVEQVRDELVETLRTMSATDLAASLARTVRRTQRAAPVGPLAQTEAARALADDAQPDDTAPGVDPAGAPTAVALREHLQARLTGGDDGASRLVSRAAPVDLTADEVTRVERLLVERVADVDALGRGLARRLLLAGVVVPG